MYPKIVFVQSLFTSKIFWAQVISLLVMIATMLGYHPAALSEANQAELVTLLDTVFTTVFRLWGTNGPVSVSAPAAWNALPPQELPAGTHTVTVTDPHGIIPQSVTVVTH